MYNIRISLSKPQSYVSSPSQSFLMVSATFFFSLTSVSSPFTTFSRSVTSTWSQKML